MTFTAAVVTLACTAPVYMVLFKIVESLFFVISCVFAQGVELNLSEICGKCVH